MKRRSVLALLPAAALTPLLRAEDPQPTGEEILRLVRLSYALQDSKLMGELRDDDTGKTEPFELTMQQNVIRFRFINPPPEIVHLDLGTAPATLMQVRPGGAGTVPMDAYGDSVRGMDFNYEDLSMRFLYWPNPKLMGEDRIRTVKCWFVRVTTPDKKGPYGTVDLWVHQESGGVARMDAYNFQGKLVKRFQVISVQKSGKATILKEMRIESFNPLNGDRKGRTYMKLDKPD